MNRISYVRSLTILILLRIPRRLAASRFAPFLARWALPGAWDTETRRTSGASDDYTSGPPGTVEAVHGRGHALPDEALDGIRGVADHLLDHEHVFLRKVREHVLRQVVRRIALADPDSYARELVAAQRLGDGAEAVVAAVRAALADAQGAELERHVVHHDYE